MLRLCRDARAVMFHQRVQPHGAAGQGRSTIMVTYCPPGTSTCQRVHDVNIVTAHEQVGEGGIRHVLSIRELGLKSTSKISGNLSIQVNTSYGPPSHNERYAALFHAQSHP